MAAPTPVRALVHRSTLVTAGIWVIILHLETLKYVSSVIIFIGITTLFVARVAALKEIDLKKVVALSTLRQLGFIAFSLSRGLWRFTLVHVLIHALAKARLFIIVGTIIFKGFSEQDTRRTQPAIQPLLIKLARIIRVLRLRGFIFLSGFFSKEAILLGFSYTNNSLLILGFFYVVLTLTFSYCGKLLYNIRYETEYNKRRFTRILEILPVVVLSISIVLSGFFINSLINRSNLLQKRVENTIIFIFVFIVVTTLLGRVKLFTLITPFNFIKTRLWISYRFKIESTISEVLTSSVGLIQSIKGRLYIIILPVSLIIIYIR